MLATDRSSFAVEPSRDAGEFALGEMLQGRDSSLSSLAKFCKLGAQPQSPKKKPSSSTSPRLRQSQRRPSTESTSSCAEDPAAGRPHSQPTMERPPKPGAMPGAKPWLPGQEYEIISGKLFFAALRPATQKRDDEAPSCVEGNKVYFHVDRVFEYFPFCKDFGPFNMGVVKRFRDMLLKTIRDLDGPGMSFVLCTSEAPEDCTNVACLIASWLVLELNWTVERAWAPFKFSTDSPFVPFRDTTREPQAFPLYVEDVLSGLYRAKLNNILSLEALDIDLYEYADHPLTADLHEVVPGRFLAFRGPSSERTIDLSKGIVKLEPKDYFPLFEVLNVSTVARLNESKYDKKDFERKGYKHVDIYFDDCTVPDALVLKAWFALCHQSSGVIAVHCKAGLGRTGVLIAAWLMRKYCFTAREVIGYLRVMRPGSVIGLQQQFLEAIQEELWEMGDPDIYEESGTTLHRLCRIYHCQTTALSTCSSRPSRPTRAVAMPGEEESRGYMQSALLALQNTEAMLANTARRLCKRSKA